MDRFTAGVAKLMRGYEEVSISEIKRRIECGEYLYECDFINAKGVSRILEMHEKLTAQGVGCTMYDHGKPSDEQYLRNWVESFYEDAAATEIDMDIPRGKLDDSSMHAMLSIIRELTANAVTHGHAKTISIRGSTVGETLVITVSDDGVGFDVATRPRTADGHFGLAGAEERALQHGGGLSVESSPGGGTRATITLASAGQVSKPSKTKNTQAQEKT